MQLTEEKLRELGAVALAAEHETRGPWDFRIDDGDAHIVADDVSIMSDMTYYPWTPPRTTLKYIAAASPDVILALITQLRASLEATKAAEERALKAERELAEERELSDALARQRETIDKELAALSPGQKEMTA